MKITGIVRRIDDLGRVVIPKELRRSMGVEDGDALEIFTTDNQVIFQKYHPDEPEKNGLTISSEAPKTDRIKLTLRNDDDTYFLEVSKECDHLLDWLFDNDFIRCDVSIDAGHDIEVITF